MKLLRVLTICSFSSVAIFNTIMAPNVMAAQDPRWFEMEVILFSQLDTPANTSANKQADDTNAIGTEQFAQTSTQLPRYRHVRDLLTPYLYPNIADIKKHLPICGQTPSSLFPHALFPKINTPTLLPEKSLEQLNQESTETYQLIGDDEWQYINTIYQAQITPTITESNITTDVNNEINQGVSLTTPTPPTQLDNSLVTISSEQQPEVQPEENIAEQLAQQAEIEQILAAVEQLFSPSNYQFIAPDFTSKEAQRLCRLSAETITTLKAQFNDFNEHGFELNEVPQTVDAIEDIDSDKPYLLSASSLQLHNIVKELKRSREFKPLLHIGWRQGYLAKTVNKAAAMRLYAGENLHAYYQKKRKQYQQEIAEQQAQEQALNNILLAINNENQMVNTTITSDNNVSATHQIIEKLALIPNDESALFEKVKQLNNQESTSDISQAPIAPSQNWTIEGVFNVHLDHYLYITADFNIADQTISQHASKEIITGQPQAINSIRFSQHRRVISQEIHYFDHPYMGMIVQIRRYQKPERQDVDNETQQKTN